ncbi:MAG: putative glutamine transporter permease protein GlnM [Pseudomonadota bacterium]
MPALPRCRRGRFTQRLRWVVLPQALRLILPPASNQFLGLIKNSSLGIAVGYPELMAVSHTALNQSGKAVECLGLTLLIYLLLSLAAAAVMGLLNRRLNREPGDA